MNGTGRAWVRRTTPRWLRNWVRNPRATGRWLRSAYQWRRRGAVVLTFGPVQDSAVAGLGLRGPQAGASTSGARGEDAMGPAPVNAWRLRCHPESARTFGLFLRDPDSIAELAEFRQAATPGMRLLDIGAHYGFFSLVALALGGEEARALAVEPS